ncbi:MAG TPA: VTT domain-containing protein, partial [Usitatibacter sp.]|nr:VTT domain-containing protein [Usitatibacter sp.]
MKRLAEISRNPLFRITAALVLASILLTAAWRWTPLNEYVTTERVVDWVGGFSRFWWAPLALAFAYTPASVIMFPRPLLTLAAVIAFGPYEGFAIAMGGVLLNTLILYLIGRYGAKEKIEKWGGPRLARVGKLLRKEGLVAVATVGLLPVAPFVVEGLAFGALRLKLRHVLPGVALAMLPGMIAAVLIGHQIAAAISSDRSANRAIIGGTVLAIVVLGF